MKTPHTIDDTQTLELLEERAEGDFIQKDTHTHR